jgi:hypothetical protein
MGEQPMQLAGSPVDGGVQEGTTTFTTSREAESYDRKTSAMDPQNDVDIETNDITSIADFLAKPVNVASFTFNSAAIANDQIYNGFLYQLVTAQSIWTRKLEGFLNIRGNIKLRLVINPTPFESGLLRLSYFPCSNHLAGSVTAHRFKLMTKTQLPGAYLNLNDNFCEVTVPYIAPTTFLERDLVSTFDHCDWGSVFVDVISPYRTGAGPLSINCSLWMSIEDLELSAMVQPQMDTSTPRKGRTIDSETNSGKGPIAKIMSSGATLADRLSSIPALTAIAKPSSWVLSALSSCAEALGWSKPTLSEGPSFFSQNMHWFNNNSDANDNCAPLSLRTDNRVSAITDASPGDLDEMSFNYIKSQWGYLSQFSWNTQLTGTLLNSVFVSPDALSDAFVVGTKTCRTKLPCSVFSEFYENWRGSFEVRMRIVKTGFHTGTIAVTWTPGRAPVVPSFADTSYMYRQIIDIQEGSEFIFNLPYLLPQDFAAVNQFSGVFTVHVVNPLIAPPNVSSTIDVVLEVRGGNDLVYTSPRNVFRTVPVVPQGIDTVDTAGSPTITAMGSTTHNLNSVHHAMIANGEIQQSLGDLLRSHYNLRFRSGSGLGATLGIPAYVAVGRTYAARYNGLTFTIPELGGDLYSFVSSFYALHRGSERYRVMCRQWPALIQQRSMLLSRGDIGGAPITYNQPASGNDAWSNSMYDTVAPTQTGSSRMIQIPASNGGLAVQAPFYSNYRYCVNELTYETGVTTATFQNRNAVAFYVGDGSSGVNLTRAIGDDFQFAYFIGVPVFTTPDPSWWVRN